MLTVIFAVVCNRPGMDIVLFMSARSNNPDSRIAYIALLYVIDHPVFPALLIRVIFTVVFNMSGYNIRNVRMSAHRVRLRRVSGDLYPTYQGKDKDKREGK